MELRQSNVAGLALDRIEAAKHAPFVAEYKTRANSFPAILVQSGLAQAIGFLRAKAGRRENDLERAYAMYLQDLQDVTRAGWAQLAQDPEAFYRDIVSADLGRYRRLTRAVLDASVWLKSLAQANLKQG